ncbi:MAG: hypothetical protein G01um101429_642 [Parcubacteria group bacterium Gr01-1014_29]|nr:MAG: hypothetical protein G01um101429_642 [Parcubacteria group bacterium Gr01-1014_29]
MKRISKQYSTKSGVALYLAVLIGTIVMATGMGVSTIFYRELRISRVLFPSFLAFYAADTGAECALYHDLQQDVFDETAPPGTFTITCNGGTRTVTHTEPVVGIDRFTFNFELTSMAGNACVDVRVKKETIGGVPCTRIDSYGRNAVCASSAATVERRLLSIDPESCLIIE